jgi:hypothetical protein
MPAGVFYAINDVEVTSPIEEVWTPVVSGVALTGRQKRSPYYYLEWRLQVTDMCYMDWFPYDNTTLTSLTCRPPRKLAEFNTFTDAVCQSVNFRQRLGAGTEVVATFLVNIES